MGGGGYKNGGGGVAWVSEFARLYELSLSLSTFFRGRRRAHAFIGYREQHKERKIDLCSEFLIKNIRVSH